MGMKAASGAAAILLLPPGVLLGVPALISPQTAQATGCLNGTTSEPAGVAAGTPVAAPTSAGPATIAGRIPSTVTAANARGQIITLDRTQLQRAGAIIAVGRTQNVPVRGQLVALMAALTESSLRVLSNTRAVPSSGSVPNDGEGRDHDSLGLFQMRPSTGWGAPRDLMDPVWSARAFYGGPTGPNHGSPRGLLDIEDWQSMTPGAAAQAVEVSAYPDRYAVNQPVAEKILAALTGVSLNADLNAGRCRPDGDTPAALPRGSAGKVIAVASEQMGTPYVWGGGTFTGPSGGGFDCSGLVLYAFYQASGGRIRLPHYSGAQIREGEPIAWAAKRPGDLIFFSYPRAGVPHHVAIYVGGDRILQAPHTGDVVRYGKVTDFAGQRITVRRIG